MALFGKKKDSAPGLIGVDIGAGGIKLVELQEKGNRLHLTTYGYTNRKSGDMSDILEDTKKGSAVLKELYRKTGAKVKGINVALPSHSVFHAIVTIPQPKNAEVDVQKMIEAQVSKLLPLPLEEMILDSTILDKDLLPKASILPKKKEEKEAQRKTDAFIPLGEKSKIRKHIRVLVSGSSKKMVQKYVDIFKGAGLKLVSLETEAFALIRSLIGNDKSRVMIVDIGYERTNITIAQEGIPYLHRSVKVGGAVITDRLAKQMGVSIEDAEQIKQDLSYADGTEMPPGLQEVMAPILHEIRYSINQYGQQQFHEHDSIEKIIITGGSAHLPYLDPLVTDAVNMNVYLGDPWARVVSPKELRPVLDEIGPRFSVAAGLAMKDFKQKKSSN